MALRTRNWLALLMPLIFWSNSGSADTCVDCHQERDPKIVAQWRNSSHTEAGCVGCHGSSHKSAAARKPEACVGCHAGSSEHSYRTSKHAVLVRLDGKNLDWSRPLVRGNYRAPSCAYCHLYEGQHDTTKSAQTSSRPDRNMQVWICSGCHSPRYAAEQLAAGDRLLEIGQLKMQEARAVRQRAKAEGFELDGFDQILEKMDQRIMSNLRLGSGHQSPDYQWWHGQPALDGMLLRIKGLYSKLSRQRLLDSATVNLKNGSKN